MQGIQRSSWQRGGLPAAPVVQRRAYVPSMRAPFRPAAIGGSGAPTMLGNQEAISMRFGIRSTAICLVVVLTFALVASADLRTRTVRLVPVQDWKAAPTDIQLSVEVAGGSDEAGQFAERLEEHARGAFEKLDYTVSDSAATRIHFRIDEFDKGKWLKRYLKGDGVVLGTITVEQGNQKLGEFRFSSRLRGGLAGTSVNQMAREVGPPLVLKLNNGERDEKLHDEG